MTRVRGRDGKSYPAWQVSEPTRLAYAQLVHTYHCRDLMSVHAVVEKLRADGNYRSTGAVYAALKRWRCEFCLQRPPG
jgi:hypothetical protein